MSLKATWNGSLSIGLITVPVKMYASYESESKLSFNQLHAECGSRIQQKTHCPKCERQITAGEIVKGYEIDKGQYVRMTKEDFDKVRVESSDTLRVTHVIEEDDLDPLYIESTSFVGPDSPSHAATFAVIREGLAGRIGIGQLTLRGREQIVGIRSVDGGIVLHFLYREEEVRKMNAVPHFQEVAAQELNPQLVQLAKQVFGTLEHDFELADFPDRYTAELRALIEARHKGEAVPEVAVVVEAKPATKDLVAAMQAMLEQASKAPKKPAKAKVAKTAKPSKKAQVAA